VLTYYCRGWCRTRGGQLLHLPSFFDAKNASFFRREKVSPGKAPRTRSARQVAPWRSYQVASWRWLRGGNVTSCVTSTAQDAAQPSRRQIVKRGELYPRKETPATPRGKVSAASRENHASQRAACLLLAGSLSAAALRERTACAIRAHARAPRSTGREHFAWCFARCTRQLASVAMAFESYGARAGLGGPDRHVSGPAPGPDLGPLFTPGVYPFSSRGLRAISESLS